MPWTLGYRTLLVAASYLDPIGISFCHPAASGGCWPNRTGGPYGFPEVFRTQTMDESKMMLAENKRRLIKELDNDMGLEGSTAVEHTPRNLEVVGSNPAG